MGLGSLMYKVASLVRTERAVSSDSEGVLRAFHGDRCYQRLAEAICSHLPITSFMETGTYLGDTTEYMARMIARPIYTAEVNDRFYRHAADRLKRYSHVNASLASSEQAIGWAIERDLLGSLPFFYLDAHWYDYWPLLDEIALITSRIERCVVIIDDFEVPDRPEFAFCQGGGGSPEFSGRTIVDERACNWKLIESGLHRPACYQLLYPRYSRADAFEGSKSGNLIGYVALLKNLSQESQSLCELPFIRKHFSMVYVD